MTERRSDRPVLGVAVGYTAEQLAPFVLFLKGTGYGDDVVENADGSVSAVLHQYNYNQHKAICDALRARYRV